MATTTKPVVKPPVQTAAAKQQAQISSSANPSYVAPSNVAAQIAAMQAQAVASSSLPTTSAPTVTNTPAPSAQSSNLAPIPSATRSNIPAPVTNNTSSAGLYSRANPTQNSSVVPLAPDPNKSLTAPGGGYATSDPAVAAQIAAMQRAASGQGPAPAPMTLPNANVPAYNPNQAYPYGTASRDTLQREAPETLVAPVRSQFVDQTSYDAALQKFNQYGRWDTDAPNQSPSTNIPFKPGLTPQQQGSIQSLTLKPSSAWNATDIANWNYATNNAPLPGATSPTTPADTVTSPTGTPSPTGASTPTPEVPPEAPAPETSNSETQYQALIDEQKRQIELLSKPSAQELADQEAYDRLVAQQANLDQSLREGYQDVSEQPIELAFLQGQSAALERRANNLETGLNAQIVPLKERLAREQARRQTSLDTSSKMFELDSKAAEASQKRADAKAEALAKQQEFKTLSPGSTVYDPATGKAVFTAPTKQEGLEYHAATKYNQAGYFDPSTGTFTPIKGSSTGSSGSGSSSGNNSNSSSMGSSTDQAAMIAYQQGTGSLPPTNTKQRQDIINQYNSAMAEYAGSLAGGAPFSPFKNPFGSLSLQAQEAARLKNSSTDEGAPAGL